MQIKKVTSTGWWVRKAWEQPCWEGLGSTGGCDAGHDPAVCAGSLGCIPSSVGTGRGGGFCPSTPLCWDPPGSPASSSGALSTELTWSCWSGARGWQSQEWSKGWNPSPVRKGWESGGYSAWRREGSGKSLLQPSSTERRPIRKTWTNFLSGPVAIGQGAMVLN